MRRKCNSIIRNSNSQRLLETKTVFVKIILVLIFLLISPTVVVAATNYQYIPIGIGTPFSYDDIPFQSGGIGTNVEKTDTTFIPISTIDLSGYTADKIHIIEYAYHGVHVPNGVIVGHINIFYKDGTFNSLDLIMGVNIAEWAYDRPENQCCLAHAKVPPAYSFWTNIDSEFYYWGYQFYVSIDIENKALDYLELVLDSASYTSQVYCPDVCQFGGPPPNWFGIGISAITLEIPPQRCVGASGAQCETRRLRGADPKHPIKRNPDGSFTGFVTVGSILHDNCCIINYPDGHMCKNGGSDQVCKAEWDKGFRNSRQNRGWWEESGWGPYLRGQGDDLTEVPARISEPQAEHETLTTSRLAAPSGTKLDDTDEEFCQSKRFRKIRRGYGICF